MLWNRIITCNNILSINLCTQLAFLRAIVVPQKYTEQLNNYNDLIQAQIVFNSLLISHLYFYAYVLPQFVLCSMSSNILLICFYKNINVSIEFDFPFELPFNSLILLFETEVNTLFVIHVVTVFFPFQRLTLLLHLFDGIVPFSFKCCIYVSSYSTVDLKHRYNAVLLSYLKCK